MKDSPFYNDAIIARTFCYMDGVKLEHCVEADEDAGWAIVLDKDYDGKPYVAAAGELATREVFGQIELRTEP